MRESGIVVPTCAFRDVLAVEDVRTLCAMTAGTGFFSEAEVGIVEELAWESITDGEESGYCFLLARDGGHAPDAPVGFACFGPVPCTLGSWHLYWVVVDQGMQGRGYGRQICREVEHRIRVQGGRKVFLETSSRDQYLSTRGFYEACGYGLESTLVDYYALGEDCLVYTKVLK